MRSVVVTGASSGIGWGTVKVLTGAGFHVFGSVRKQADADRLKKEFGDKVTPLVFDVTDEAAIARAAAEVRTALKGETLAGLVNNAGMSVAGPLAELPTEEFRLQMEVNLTGPFLVTKAFVPLLGADKSYKGAPGRIVNISSVGGKRAFPFIGAYAASKFALEGYSEALRRELMIFGIDVIVIGPGPVKTAIWDKAEEIDVKRYSNSPYFPVLNKFRDTFVAQGKDGYPPEKIGRIVLKALTAAKPKVRYAAVKGSPVQGLMLAVLPKRTLDRIIGKTLGLLSS